MTCVHAVATKLSYFHTKDSLKCTEVRKWAANRTQIKQKYPPPKERLMMDLANTPERVSTHQKARARIQSKYSPQSPSNPYLLSINFE